MIRLLTALLLLATLSACGKMQFVKEGATPDQEQADRFDCKQKVYTMYGGPSRMGAGDMISARDDFEQCMTSKGWKRSS